MKQIRAQYTASISKLKQNPSAIIEASQGNAVAILNHNTTTAYLIPAGTYELLMEIYDDYELAKVVKKRAKEKNQAIDISIDDL